MLLIVRLKDCVYILGMCMFNVAHVCYGIYLLWRMFIGEANVAVTKGSVCYDHRILYVITTEYCIFLLCAQF